MRVFNRIFLVVGFLFSLSIPTVQADTIRIGMVLPDFTQNQLILDLHDQAQAAAKEEGVELLVTGRGAAEEQVAAVENYVAAGVDVLVYDTTDSAAMTGAILKANAAGIPVVCVIACAEGGEHAALIWYDYRTMMGRPLGEWIVSVTPAGGKVGVIDSNQADPSIRSIYDGINDALEGSNLELVISPPTNWDRAAALNIARDLLIGNPDFDTVVGFHDLITGATLTAMAELGYPSVPISGLGGTCEGLANVLSGTQSFTVIQPLAPAGYHGIKAAASIARGGEGANVGVPMVALDTAYAKAILAGTEGGNPNGVDVLTVLQKAASGC